MTAGYWQRSDRLGTLRCDVLVVGGGICGVSAALHLQRRGVDARLVESHTIGYGASGRNAGFLMRGCADNYAVAITQYGRPLASELWRLTERNLAGLRGEGIDALPTTRRIPSVLAAVREDELSQLRQSATLLREDGFDVGWWDASDHPDDALWRHAPVHGALVNPHDGAGHSGHVLGLLAGKLTLPVHERQEVLAIHASGAGVRVELREGIVLARRVLVCTNAYAPLLLPALAGVVAPKRGQMLAMRMDQGFGTLAASYYINFGSEYVRQAWDGSVLVGGCRTYHAEREAGYEDRTTPWVQGDLERFAALLLGEGGTVVARWAGTMGFTPHHLPVIVPVAHADVPADGRLWFVGGFTGHGMSMAYEVSRLAVGAMLDGSAHPLPAPPPAKA